MPGNWFERTWLTAAIVALFGVVGAAIGAAWEAEEARARLFYDALREFAQRAGLFSAHPSTQGRIAFLQAMAR